MKAEARAPRGAVKLAGINITSWDSVEVDNNVHRSADTFRVVLIADALPKKRNVSWLASQTTIEVEVYMTETPRNPEGYAPQSGDLLLTGRVDELDYDPAANTVELSGRDLTALLIDTKTSEHFANQTASQIAQTLAGRHGLTPVVVPTKIKAGEYYQIDHADVTQEQSEWELLTRLAAAEDYTVYVRGHELHFEPSNTTAGDYPIVWTPPTATQSKQADLNSLKFTRDLTIVKGVSVEVRSWNAKQKKSFTQSWPKAPKAVKPGGSESPQVYRYTIAGLTPDQAQKRAQNLYAQIAAHMVKLEAELPGDALLNCNKTVTVQGTGTTFDQVYYPDSVKRSLSVSEGYRMTFSAKNQSDSVEAGKAND